MENTTSAPRKNYLNNKDLLAEVIVSKQGGAMTNKLALMLQMLTKRYAKKGNFANYCVDEQTSALTKRGWKTIHEISENDEILSYDVDTKTLVWSKLFGIFKNQNYNDQMHYLTTEGLDALVSPNHKFVSEERGIIPVEDIICNEHIVLMGDPVLSDVVIHRDNLVELVGWAITEGHFSTKSKNRHSISISQKQGPKSDRIRSILISENVNFKERFLTPTSDIIVFDCNGKTISSIHSTFAPKRVLSYDFILSLTHNQRILLINTMVSGDGWIRPSGGMSYFQKCKDHIDAFLMLCTLSGLTTSTSITTSNTPVSKKKPEGGTSVGYTVNIYASPKKVCKSESIDFHGGRPTPGGRREHKFNSPTQPYNGIIWCPQTEHGTFVCRRNKYIYITGNSYNEDMQAYALLMLCKTWASFDENKSNNPFAFFTQCIKNSFIQYLNQERRVRDIKNKSLIEHGFNPSFSYILEYEEEFHERREAAINGTLDDYTRITSCPFDDLGEVELVDEIEKSSEDQKDSS